MKALIIKDKLNQDMVNSIKLWLGKDKLITNSMELVALAPHIATLQSVNAIVHDVKKNNYDLVIAYNDPRHVVDDDYFIATTGTNKILINDQPVIYTPKSVIRIITTPNGATLRPYQTQMVDFTLKQKRVGLFVDMGLGKTLATLATINELFESKQLDPTKPILIVAPKMVALDTWAREAEKWGYDIDVLVNIGLTKRQRNKLFDKISEIQKPTILTTNPAQLENLITYFTLRYESFPFECVVIDELSLFKSSETNRFKYITTLTQNVKYFIGLTGTPAPNSLLDIWSQMIVIDPNNRYLLTPNFYTYRSKYFEPDIIDKRTGQVFKWKLKPNAEDEIYKQMRKTVISMRSDGLVDLPDVTYIDEIIPLPPKILSEYKKFEKEVRNEFKHDAKEALSTIDGNDVIVKNKAVLTSKLLQLASGAVYNNLYYPTNGDDFDAYTVYHDEKLNKLKEIIETSTSPILVFYNFKSDIERARKLFKFEELNPNDPNIKDIIKRWNKGDIPVLFAHPQSTGHGLNLQDGGHTIVWLTLTWMNEVYRQANKRLHRSGQKHPVQIIHLIAKDTVDTEVVSRLNTKEDGQQKLLDSLKPN